MDWKNIKIPASDLLPDPKKDRQVKDVPLPIHKPLTKELLFPTPSSNKPNWKTLYHYFMKEGRLLKEQVLKILSLAIETFSIYSYNSTNI